MPELPEVETTRRGIAPWVEGHHIQKIIVRQHALRWPVPQILSQLRQVRVESVERRGKYLLFYTSPGTIIVHLGMSGSMQIVDGGHPLGRHDHVDLCMDNGQIIRFTDPRRFGAWLWTEHDPLKHKLLRQLGPEPLSPEFSGTDLYRLSRARSAPVKTFLMDGRVVTGVGNIYANESLFQAGIHPKRAAGRISLARYEVLAIAVKNVLFKAIEQGGTTLRDFVGGDGRPGYFKQELSVYGRGGEICHQCGTLLTEIRLGQRSTVFCKICQT